MQQFLEVVITRQFLETFCDKISFLEKNFSSGWQEQERINILTKARKSQKTMHLINLFVIYQPAWIFDLFSSLTEMLIFVSCKSIQILIAARPLIWVLITRWPKKVYYFLPKCIRSNWRISGMSAFGRKRGKSSNKLKSFPFGWGYVIRGFFSSIVAYFWMDLKKPFSWQNNLINIYFFLKIKYVFQLAFMYFEGDLSTFYIV